MKVVAVDMVEETSRHNEVYDQQEVTLCQTPSWSALRIPTEYSSMRTQSGTQCNEYDNGHIDGHIDDMRHAESDGRDSTESGGRDGSCRQHAL